MNKAATLLIVGLLALLIFNGGRLTFFPATTCGLARKNQAIPLSQSVMEFHREQEERNATRTQPE